MWGVEGVLSKGGGMVRRDWRARPERGAIESKGEGRGAAAKSGAAMQEKGANEPVPATVALSSEDEHDQRPWSPPDSPEQGWLSLVRPPEYAPAATGTSIEEASMDDLASVLEGVSLTMVPRSVLKARTRAQAQAKTMDVEHPA